MLLATAMMVSLSAGAGVSAKTVTDPSGDWIRAKNGKWWYQYTDGTWPTDSWLRVNGKWYHFDKAGWMQTGWVKDGNDWYYLNANGSMRTGWVKTGENWYYLSKSGRMRTGWLMDNDKWYFLGPNGAMKTGDITVKGNRYRMGNDGALLLDLTALQQSEAPLAESGFRMLQTIYETEDVHNKNVLISPVSAQIALGLAITGADPGSNTQKELIESLMPGSNVTSEDYSAAMKALSERMTSARKGVSWNVANSVWARNGGAVEFRDSYIDAVKEVYSAEDFEEPFNADTVQKINNWVKENTRDRIPQIIESIDSDTVIFLINALAFDGYWSDPVADSSVKEKDFTNADGTTSKVNMMYTHEHRAILLNDGIGFIKPYQGGEYSFVAILPPEGKSAEEYLEQLVYTDGETFTRAFLNPDTERGVNCGIPEFKVEYGVVLNDTLTAMGVNEAFDDSKASFGAMVTDESTPVAISEVIQKTMIQVDRKGTQAAAATMVDVKSGAVLREVEPYEVYLDRPFVYGIVDNTTGVPIFLGVQNCMPRGE